MISKKQATKDVFTTGEVAKICHISQQTVIRCFDSGQLKGFRIPGSRFRKVPRDQLYTFMKDNGIPTDELDDATIRVIVLTSDEQLATNISEAIAAKGDCKIILVDNQFDAGIHAMDKTPDALIIDCTDSAEEAEKITDQLRKYPGFDDVVIVALVPKNTRVKRTIADINVFRKPLDPALFAASLLETITERKSAL